MRRSARAPKHEAQHVPARQLAGDLVADESELLVDRIEVAALVVGLAQAQGAASVREPVLQIRLFGRGARGSMPQASIDPLVMAAATVMRLQTVVSRELAATEAAVVTIGSLQAGTKENVIPVEAIIKLNVRSFDEGVRKRVLAAIERIVKAGIDRVDDGLGHLEVIPVLGPVGVHTGEDDLAGAEPFDLAGPGNGLEPGGPPAAVDVTINGPVPALGGPHEP